MASEQYVQLDTVYLQYMQNRFAQAAEGKPLTPVEFGEAMTNLFDFDPEFEEEQVDFGIAEEIDDTDVAVKQLRHAFAPFSRDAKEAVGILYRRTSSQIRAMDEAFRLMSSVSIAQYLRSEMSSFHPKEYKQAVVELQRAGVAIK